MGIVFKVNVKSVKPKMSRHQNDINFYIIKTNNESDIIESIQEFTWSCNDIENDVLNQSFQQGPVYLFFSVNRSRHFCGVAEMISPVTGTGLFKVSWILIKDVP